MPAASSATYNAPASMPSSSRSMPAIGSSSSRADADASLPDHGLQFIANHHRQHNPNDPKLRAKPVFKSRRSSLLGSVLKPKIKDEPSRRLSKLTARSTTAAAAAASTLQPRKSSRPAHHHTQSLPTFAAASPPARPHDQVDDVATLGPEASQDQGRDTHPPQSDHQAERDMTDEREAKTALFQISVQPPTASLPSPVEICSSPDSTADVGTDAVPSLSPSFRAPSAPGNDEPVLVPEPSPGPSIPRMPHSTSAPVISPQRFSSLSRRSAAHLAVDPDPQSAFPPPRAPARGITDELDSPTSRESRNARADRRMSMLDFLSADPNAEPSPQLIQASLSAEDLPRSVQTIPPSPFGSSSLAPPSIPLLQASRRLRLEAAAIRSGLPLSRTLDLCDNVRVSVEPLVDRLTMFGSMQSSSNYSLAGSVVVEIPKLHVPRLSSAAGLARDGSTADQPSVHVESLIVRFTGFSVYVDATGRFNAIKLTETSQELLPPEGHSCMVELSETGDQSVSLERSTAQRAGNNASQDTLKYETEFDLSVPGWLPASQRSRFGATFYCVQATAIVQGRAILSALAGYDGEGSDGLFAQSSPLSPAESLESELLGASIGAGVASSRDGPLSSASTLVRSKTKKTWLNKTAKQLQLRTSKKSNGADSDQSTSTSNSRRGSASKDALQIPDRQDPLFTKTTEASNLLLPTGQHTIKSESLSILVRRCRDVVPVPVARLARLATASQLMREAGTNPSLTQSMVALAGLQEEATDDGRSQGRPQPLSTNSGRSDLPASASMPVSLASRASGPPSYPAHSETSPDATTTNADEQRPALLAPSPRIDEPPPSWSGDQGQEGIHDESNESSLVSQPAPSAFDTPQIPAKLAAASSSLTPSATLPNLPSSMSRASSLLDSRFGNANSPPRTSSRTMPLGRSSAPLRHFVHRPTLHLPPELGVTPDANAAGGLNFSLTLSLPSHVHITGPKSDVLSFGVQIEVGRTAGWDALKKWGGLRLKDMEIVCLQTERHSSMPSRSFCAVFPVPPSPNRVDAADLPVVTHVEKAPPTSSNTSDVQIAAEKRLRQSYDRSLVLAHIDLANQGKEPHPIENNVERIRTTLVGPPPIAPQDRRQESGKADDEATRKWKARSHGQAADLPGPSRSPSHGSPADSGTNTPDGTSQSAGLSGLRAAFAPAAQVQTGSRMSVMQPLPRALAHSRNSSSSSLRLAFQGSDGSSTMQPRPGSSGNTLAAAVSHNASDARSRRPIPFEFGSAPSPVTSSRSLAFNSLSTDPAESTDVIASEDTAQPSQGSRHAPGHAMRSNFDEAARRGAPEAATRDGIPSDSHAMRMGISSTVTTGSNARSRTAAAPRRSRFETAINRLSTFASSMLEQPNGASTADSSMNSRGSGKSSVSAEAYPRATYAFSGDDGQGVDLNKGRVRMTINLPLVSSDPEAARKAGSAQLISDFESPYVRIRHKLKVKLGFGFLPDVASGKNGEDWAQALVMCVPVRFTEAPPKEVQDQFGPVDVPTSEPSSADASSTTAARAQASEESTNSQATPGQGPPVSFAEPLLPAYAQLFREDGSRLADEGEDLPRYPGRMSVVGEIDEDPVPEVVADYGQEAGDRSASQEEELASAIEGATVLEAGASDATSASTSGDDNQVDHRPSGGPSRGEVTTLPRLSSLLTMPMPMDRTTSLPGRRLLSRTSYSGVYGLRPGPSHPAAGASSHRSASSPFAHLSSTADDQPRFGSPAFDPLPTRPGMRRRSATTASLVSFSRITPAEVLDEALVTSALDDEEDRMDCLQPSDTLRSLNALSSGGMEGMDESGNDDEVGDFDDEVEREEDEVYEELHDVDRPGMSSEVGSRHHRLGALRQLVGNQQDETDSGEGEIGRAF